MFSAKLNDYFPNIPIDTIGLTYTENAKNKAKSNSQTILLMTAKQGLQVINNFIKHKHKFLWSIL